MIVPMSARSPRRRFAPPLVLTFAGAASLAACGGKPAPAGPNANPPRPLATTEATWRVDTTAPDACTATLCKVGDFDCPPENAQPYPCIPGKPSVIVIRHEGETECAYNGAPPYEMPDCPPEMSCNPPPPEWKPVAVLCPDNQ